MQLQADPENTDSGKQASKKIIIQKTKRKLSLARNSYTEKFSSLISVVMYGLTEDVSWLLHGLAQSECWKTKLRTNCSACNKSLGVA